MQLYRVKEGDTLAAIARTHGILPTELCAACDLPPDAEPTIGRVLPIRTPREVHEVKEGESLETVARRHRTSIARLRQLNPALHGGSELYPGVSLTISTATAPLGSITVLGFAQAETPPEEVIPVLPYLSYLAVLSCKIGEGSTLLLPEDTAIIKTARVGGVIPILVLTAAGEDGREGEVRRTRALLSEECGRSITDALLPLVRARGYGGILLDLPILPEYREAYTAFSAHLRRRLGHTAIVLTTLPTVTAEDSPLGRAVGGMLLETHALSSRFRSPSPASPYDQVAKIAEDAAAVIRPQKLLLGLSTRAEDFPVSGGSGRVLPYSEVEERIAAGGRLGYDPIGRVPYLSYCEREENRILFFEDAESIREKLMLADHLSLGGVALHPAIRTDPTVLLLLAELFHIIKPHGEA